MPKGTTRAPRALGGEAIVNMTPAAHTMPPASQWPEAFRAIGQDGRTDVTDPGLRRTRASRHRQQKSQLAIRLVLTSLTQLVG
jgi:hypothetical protein